MKIQPLALTSAFRAMAPMAPAPAASAPPAPQDGVQLSRGQAAAPTTFEVVKRVPSQTWAWTELLHDPDPNFVQRNFHPRQVQRNPEVVAAFGTGTPHSGNVLLHYAGDPPAGVPRHETPVLLVHGASKDGNYWWDPKEDGSEHGLPQFLRDQGYQVYAVTFAHNHDDNFQQAEQVANAVDRLKGLTGQSQVDLVAHSKGCLPARMYTSDVRQPWMTPFREDVRRLVLIGGPNGGIDYSFRHPVANFALYGDSDNPRLNAPISWERMMAWGSMKDTSDVGFGSAGPDYWPGQRQMLGRWDGQYRLSLSEPDFYTTYHGGRGFVSLSKGIDHYIAEGGNLIQRLAEKPVDPSVQVAVLAGNRPNVPGILNETTGPSDGLVFVQSALQLPDEVQVTAQKVMPLHHKAITSETSAHRWVADVLGEEQPKVLSPKERTALREAALREGQKYLKEAPEEASPSLFKSAPAAAAPALASALAMPAGEERFAPSGSLFTPGGNLLV